MTKMLLPKADKMITPYKGPLDLYEKHNFKIIKEYVDYYVVRKYLR